ncbi:hypothetical protein GT045_25040 [Streptomyces sp. SID486]|uniref:hypothetical protein n=1 Tax=unclassified Streptomyces TaxID=2593676 RepID=UPI00136871DD|nr:MULTISPECIES: hypothetical protein [unclassified Streptomyces]MYW16230.1 hypothetical protein [Streptomyces sp. SID2955]MYW46471.1 hypothetical protein [Streptomyces sp. SID161]MYX97986.1 hypothetical protein [Streptomyces sp. SID486]
MSDHRKPPCRGPYGGEGRQADGTDCSDPAVFEVTRHNKPPLLVCPVHLGPSLLMAGGVLWPPVIHLIGRVPDLRP